MRNLQGDALVDLLRDAGPDGKVYVARVVAANLALLGRHRQQRLSRQRLGVDPERNLNAAGVGQHDLFVDRLVERLPAKVDGRGVQFVLDEVRIRRQFDVVCGSTLDFAHGHRANLRVRLGKVRDLHAFLFARLEVAADGEDVEDLLGIRIFERRVGIALGPASFYPLRLVESLVHHLLDHRRLILVDVRVVVRLEHPLEPRGDRSCVSHRDVLTLCGVVEDAAKVDERVAEVEVGERKLRAEVDGIDVRIIVVAHQQFVANLVRLAVAAVIGVERDPDSRRLVRLELPIRLGLDVKRWVHLDRESQGDLGDVAHGDRLLLDLVLKVWVVRKLECEGVFGEVHQRDGNRRGRVNCHHLLCLPVRTRGVFTHQSLNHVTLVLGYTRESEHHRGFGRHGDLLRRHRERDAQLAVGGQRLLLLFLDADLLQVALLRILLRCPLLDRLLDFLFGGDVVPHQLLQLARVVRDHNLAVERSVLELRAKVDGVWSVEVGTRGQAPDALGCERNHERRALDDHHVEFIPVHHELVHVHRHRESVLLTGLKGLLPGVHEKCAVGVLHKGSNIRGNQRLVRDVNHLGLVSQHGHLAPLELGDPDGVRIVRFLREPERGSTRVRGYEQLHRGFGRPDCGDSRGQVDETEALSHHGERQLEGPLRVDRPRRGFAVPRAQTPALGVLRLDDKFSRNPRAVFHRDCSGVLVPDEARAKVQGSRGQLQRWDLAVRREWDPVQGLTHARYVHVQGGGVPGLSFADELELNLLFSKRQNRPGRWQARELTLGVTGNPEREPHRDFAPVMNGEVLCVPEPVAHDAEIEALRVNRKRRADNFSFEVQRRRYLPVHDLPLERLVELAQRVRAQRHDHGLDLPHGYDPRGRLERKVHRRSRPGLRRDEPKLGGNLASVHELNLVLVHRADEHVANLQGVVREHRDGSDGVALE